MSDGRRYKEEPLKYKERNRTVRRKCKEAREQYLSEKLRYCSKNITPLTCTRR